MRALCTALIAFLIDLLTHVFDVLLAACNEVDFLFVARDGNIEHGVDAITGASTSLLNQEAHGANLVEKRKAAWMRNSIQHHINALLLDEHLVDITGSAARVPEAETGKNVLLINVPKIRIVIDALRRDGKELGLRGKLNLRVSDDPFLLCANLHERKLLDVIALAVEDAASGTRTKDGQGSTDQ